MKKNWPPIRKVTIRKKTMYCVDARIGGKGERKFFQSKKEAEGFALKANTRRKNEGTSAMADERLAGYGWSVQRAIEFALDHLQRRGASIPITAAAQKMLESKTASGRSDGYLLTLKINLAKYEEAFDKRPVADITVNDIESFLTGLALAPSTKNTIRRDGVTLWSYAIKMGWASVNVVEAVDPVTDIGKTPGLLSPDQAEALLKASSDSETVVYHAVALFAGLRVAEVKRLDWSDIDLQCGYITVTAANSKTRARRLVPIVPCLKKWIMPMAKAEGPVISRDIRIHHIAAREEAKILSWPDNAMRHSYVSYRLAATGNAAQVALEAGHDEAVLFKHYRQIVKPKDAKAYFAIIPEPASTSGTKVAKKETSRTKSTQPKTTQN